MTAVALRRLARATIDGWFRDSAQQHAAALAYYTVFSLAPLLLIAIGLAGLAFGEDAARRQVLAQATSLVGSVGAGAIETLMGSRGTAQHAGLISTIVGFLALVLGAVGVVGQLRAALNTVWQVDSSGMSWSGFLRGYLMNMAFVVGAGFLLLVSLVATAVLSAATGAVRSYVPGPDLLWFTIDAAMGILLTSGLFAVMFHTVPDTEVPWRDAFVGAAVTAVLFTAGRIALGLFLGRQGSESPYQAAGSVLGLLAWVYYSAQLVLAGAEFTAAFGRRPRAGDRRAPEATMGSQAAANDDRTSNSGASIR